MRDESIVPRQQLPWLGSLAGQLYVEGRLGSLYVGGGPFGLDADQTFLYDLKNSAKTDLETGEVIPVQPPSSSRSS